MEVATVLPNELRLGAPPTMPQARSYMFRQQSTLQSYSGGNQIQINIPRLQRSYLRKDSYLRFNVDIQETGSNSENPLSQLTFDSAGAYGLIQKIEVLDYLGSTVLESISEVPQLMALLLDMGIPGIDHNTQGQACMGLETGYSAVDELNFATSTTNTVSAMTSTFKQNNKLRAASCGRTLSAYSTSGSGTSLVKYYTTEFAIPLPSFLGFLSKKMVPLHNGFTILITLATPETAMFTPGKSPASPSVSTGSTASAPVTLTVSATGITVVGTTATAAYTGTTVTAGSTVTISGATPDGLNVTNATVLTATASNFTYTVPSGTASASGTTPTVVAWVAANALATNPYSTAAIAASTTKYAMTVTDVLMDCQILELGPVAESMILSSTGGQPLVVHTKSFRSYVGNVNKKAQEFILNLNLNVASMTNILWMMRSKDQLEKINHQSIGNRTRNMLQRWFFQYGSTTLPQNNGIQTMGTIYPSGASTLIQKYIASESKCGEGFQELMKARPVDLQNSRILQENYSWDYKWNGTVVDYATLTDTASQAMVSILNLCSYTYPTSRPSQWLGKFAAGLNLELASNKSGDLISGLNTNGMNTSIRGVFHPLFTDFLDDVRVDAYAEYDAFINISPGIATTVSF